MKIVKFIFIVLLFLELVVHCYVNIDIGKNFVDYTWILTVLLIVSLLIERHLFSVILLVYAFIIVILNFSPMFMLEKNVEKIYHIVFLGPQLSSYIRNNITNLYWIVNPIMNLSFFLAGFIILLEIPYRQYKKSLFHLTKQIRG